MSSQDPYGLDNLLADCENGELPDFQQTFNLGIETNSVQNTEHLELDRPLEPRPRLQRSIVPQGVENENGRVTVNPGSGSLQVLNDLPEEFGMMNDDGTIRELENSERPDRDVGHEKDDAGAAHKVNDDRQALAAHTQKKRRISLSDADGQDKDPDPQGKVKRVSQMCAPAETEQAPNMPTDTTLNQHNVLASHVLQTQVQPQLNVRNAAPQLIDPTSPLGRLSAGLQNALLAHARRQAYIEAEAHALQMAQNAALRIHVMAQNGEMVLSTAGQEGVNTQAALQRTPATTTKQPVQNSALQEQAPVVRDPRSLSSSKKQAIRELPPNQTLPPTQRPPSPHLVPSVPQNLASNRPNSNAGSHAAGFPHQDISRVSYEELQSDKLAVLKNYLASVPTRHTGKPHQPCGQFQGAGSSHILNAQPASLNHSQLLDTGTEEQGTPSETLKNPLVSTKKRKRAVAQNTERFHPDVNTPTVEPSRGIARRRLTVTEHITRDAETEAQASAVNSRMGAPPPSFALPSPLQRRDEMNSLGRDVVEEIMEMNGLRGQNQGDKPQISETPNGHHVVVNKYGVKLRFSKNGQASKYCHVCGRSALTAPVAECANLLIGLCQKVICEKCSLLHDPEYAPPGEVGNKRSLCIHCRANCPEDKARCFQYSRNNEKRRTRNLEKKRQKKERQEQENNHLQDDDDLDGASGISPTGVSDPNVF